MALWDILYNRFFCGMDAKIQGHLYSDDAVKKQQLIEQNMGAAAENAKKYYQASKGIQAHRLTINLARTDYNAFTEQSRQAIARNVPKFREQYAKSMDARAVALIKEVTEPWADELSMQRSQRRLGQQPRQRAQISHTPSQKSKRSNGASLPQRLAL